MKAPSQDSTDPKECLGTRARIFVCWASSVALAVLPVCSAREATDRANIDIAPPDGRLAGCEVFRSDTEGALVLCPIDKDQPEGLSRMYALATSELIPDRATRTSFNLALNRHLAHPLVKIEDLPSDFDDSFLWSDIFLRILFKMRNSAVWYDQNRAAPFDIFRNDAAQPLGAQLLAEHLCSLAENEGKNNIRRGDIAFLISRAPKGSQDAFRVVAKSCTSMLESSRGRELCLLAAIGLSRYGEDSFALQIVNDVRVRVDQLGSDYSRAQVERVRSFLQSPNWEPESLGRRLDEWFELEFD